MAEINIDKNKQAEVFLQAIHADTIEEKGRILQKNPELIDIVKYYDSALKSHSLDNKEFQAQLKSGEYENMLADDIRAGRLKMFSPQNQAQIPIELTNKDFDSKTNMLNGFDIELSKSNQKLHVDLTNYLPQGKSDAEVQQVRNDFYDMYQHAIKNNPERAEITLSKLAKDFPDGISWRDSSQAVEKSISSDTLNMQGKPNLGVIASPSIGEAFFRLHADRATSPLNNSQSDNTLMTLKDVAITINKNIDFSQDQKYFLNNIIAERLNQTAMNEKVITSPGIEIS